MPKDQGQSVLIMMIAGCGARAFECTRPEADAAILSWHQWVKDGAKVGVMTFLSGRINVRVDCILTMWYDPHFVDTQTLIQQEQLKHFRGLNRGEDWKCGGDSDDEFPVENDGD